MPRPFALIGFTVFFTLSILYELQTGATVAAFAVFSAALVVTLLIRKIRKAKVFTVAAVSGLLSCVLLICSNSFIYQPIASLEGRTFNLTAVITSEADLNYGNYYYDAKVSEVDGKTADFGIRLTFSTPLDAEPFDSVNGRFNFYLPGSSSSELLSANKAKGIYIAAYPSAEGYTVIENENGNFIGRKITELRNIIKDSVYRILPNEYGGLAVALILGDKSGISRETLSDFNAIGITHLICVSGLHLSLWSMLVLKIFRKTGLNEKIAAVISAVFVILFMLVAGMSHSVVRAGIMMLVYLFSILISRKSDSLNSLGFAITVIALVNPFSIGAVGLQLSVLSCLGLILYVQFFRPKIDELLDKSKIPKRLLESVLSAFSVTAAASAFTLPVTLQLYGSFNFAVFASNFLCVTAAGICMVLCMFGAIFGALLPGVFNIFGFLGGLFCKYILAVSDFISRFDFLTFRIEYDKAVLLICGMLLISALAVLVSYFGKAKPILSVVLGAVMFCTGLFIFSSGERKETKLRVVDVGNGTSVLMEYNGETVLFGCGGSVYSGSYDILNAVERAGKLDYLVVSDDDESSSAYALSILRNTEPKAICYSALPSGAELLLGGIETNRYENPDFSDNIEICSTIIDSSYCVLAKTEDVSALICFDPVKSFSALPENFRNADIIITRNDYPADLSDYDVSYTVINAENTRGIIIQNELESKGIKCASTAGCGDLIIRADNGDISVYRN